MKQSIFRAIAVGAALGLSASTFASSSKLDDELLDIHKIMAALAAQVAMSWETLDTDANELTDVKVACDKLTLKEHGGVLSSALGSSNTVKSAVCDENGEITIVLADANINKALRLGTFTLQAVKKTDVASEGYQKMTRTATYGGTATNLLPIDTFVCEYTFGAIGDADKQDIQLSQPKGSTKKINHFAVAEAKENPQRKGLNSYCKGSIKTAVDAAITPVTSLVERTAD